MNPATPAVKPAANQSQWALISREFHKRRLAVIAAWVILTLITVSIWAPFLANDRPLYFYGVQRFEYREAVRTLREVLGRLPANGKDIALSPEQEKLQRDLKKSILRQSRIIRTHLPPEKWTALDDFVHDVFSSNIESSGNGRILIRSMQKKLQQDYAENAANAVVLQSQRRFPVLASLTWGDVFFLTMNVLVLGWVFASYLRRGSLRRRWLGPLVICVVPAICALLWWCFIPSRVDRTPYKRGVLAAMPDAGSAPVTYQQVMWPPISYAIDEDSLSDKTMPPAWMPQGRKTNAKSTPWDGPHWLGTDELGRDVLCRMIWGGRVSLSVGIVAVAIYVSIGIVVGALAGYFRGFWDLVISRLIEVVICFPAFFLILTIVAFVGPGLLNIMVVIGLTGWTGIARLVRGEFLRLVDQEFVMAGRALGYSNVRLIFRHILPNAMAPVLVSATFGIAGAILTESALSFLGLGISVPTPSWGSILAEGRNAIFRAPWLILYPGFAIFLTITSYNLVGEALRDASDPRLRGSR